MNDIVAFSINCEWQNINELWMTKGHNLALWTTLWATKRVTILWTTALLISQMAYLFKKFSQLWIQTSNIVGFGCCERELSVRRIWPSVYRDVYFANAVASSGFNIHGHRVPQTVRKHVCFRHYIHCEQRIHFYLFLCLTWSALSFVHTQWNLARPKFPPILFCIRE